MKKRVPSDRLLIFNAKDGIEPLAKFCNVEIPSWKFPHVNDKKEFQKQVSLIYLAARLFLITISLFVYGLLSIITGNEDCNFILFKVSANTCAGIPVLIVIILRLIAFISMKSWGTKTKKE